MMKMMSLSTGRIVTPLARIVLAMSLSACSGAAQSTPPRTVQPGAPGEEGRVLAPGEAVRFEFPSHTEADVHFMRMMIPHHEQALEMAALVPERTERRDVRMMALRIQASQADEIALMKQWLERRGESFEAGGGHSPPYPESGGHEPRGAHPAGHELDGPAQDPHAGMPGMLSPEQMEQLGTASGEEFDRLFLEYMIMHHEGAITMVQELFRSEAGGQEGEIYQMAAHIDSDQKMEILRMRRMLLGEL